jgi:hypothetical protein
MGLISTIRELLHVTHCMNARACVAYNLARVEQAKRDLDKAFKALDKCNARAVIQAYEEPQSVPESLLKGN